MSEQLAQLKKKGGGGAIKNELELELTTSVTAAWVNYITQYPYAYFQYKSRSNDTYAVSPVKVSDLSVYPSYVTVGTTYAGHNVNVARSNDAKTIYLSISNVETNTVKCYGSDYGLDSAELQPLLIKN